MILIVDLILGVALIVVFASWVVLLAGIYDTARTPDPTRKED